MLFSCLFDNKRHSDQMLSLLQNTIESKIDHSMINIQFVSIECFECCEIARGF